MSAVQEARVALTRARNHEYYLANKTEMNHASRRYADEHADELRDYRRRYYAAHKDKKLADARRWYSENKTVANERSRQHRIKNRDRYADTWLRKRYGITLAERNERLAAQGSRCAICRAGKPGGRGWQVDHEHDSGGRVRGILCFGCNTSLGGFRESPQILHAAIQYLRGGV
jgi:hypothetical protein